MCASDFLASHIIQHEGVEVADQHGDSRASGRQHQVDPANTHALGRCGYGMRQPFLVISPFALENAVDHTVTDQTSVIHFVEDNWLGGQRIGQGSFDAIASPINQMFDFRHHRTDGRLLLDPRTGAPVTE